MIFTSTIFLRVFIYVLFFFLLLQVYTKDTLFLFFYFLTLRILLKYCSFQFSFQICYNGILLGIITIGTTNIWSTSSVLKRFLLANNAIRLNNKKIIIQCECKERKNERKKNGDQYKSRMYHIFLFLWYSNSIQKILPLSNTMSVAHFLLPAPSHFSSHHAPQPPLQAFIHHIQCSICPRQPIVNVRLRVRNKTTRKNGAQMENEK